MNHKLLLLAAALLTSCHWQSWRPDNDNDQQDVVVQRFDRIESLYLTTGDFSALQHLNLSFPMQTRTLIEDILKIGQVDEPDINSTFLNFFQDTTLQMLISEAERQYAQMDDINSELTYAFKRLREWLPNMPVPLIYAQVAALDQSIVVANGAVGVSLEKYLGADYPIYQQFDYSPQQLQTMTREYVVPDILSFYLLSLYPLADFQNASQPQRDRHIAKIQWTVNHALRRQVFRSDAINMVEQKMKGAKPEKIEDLLKD